MRAALRGPPARTAVGIGDLGDRAADERAERVERVADRHQRESLHVVRHPEHRLHLILAADVVGGDRGAEPERAAREDDVLDCRVDAGAADALYVALLLEMPPATVGLRRPPGPSL